MANLKWATVLLFSANFIFAQNDSSLFFLEEKRFKVGIDFLKLGSPTYTDNSSQNKLEPSSRFEVYSSYQVTKWFSLCLDGGYSVLNSYYFDDSFIERAQGIYIKPGFEVSLLGTIRRDIIRLFDCGFGSRLGITNGHYKTSVYLVNDPMNEKLETNIQIFNSSQFWYEGYTYVRFYPFKKLRFSLAMYIKLRANESLLNTELDNRIHHIPGYGQNTRLSPALNFEFGYHF